MCNKRWWVRFHKKNGKVGCMPWYHKLDFHLDDYIKTVDIGENCNDPPFRAAIGRTGQFSERPMGRTNVWYMIQRRSSDSGLKTEIVCHALCGTGITDYLTSGGKLEIAQRMAGHSNAKTTRIYDRRNDEISVGEVERIGI